MSGALPPACSERGPLSLNLRRVFAIARNRRCPDRTPNSSRRDSATRTFTPFPRSSAAKSSFENALARCLQSVQPDPGGVTVIDNLWTPRPRQRNADYSSTVRWVIFCCSCRDGTSGEPIDPTAPTSWALDSTITVNRSYAAALDRVLQEPGGVDLDPVSAAIVGLPDARRREHRPTRRLSTRASAEPRRCPRWVFAGDRRSHRGRSCSLRHYPRR